MFSENVPDGPRQDDIRDELLEKANKNELHTAFKGAGHREPILQACLVMGVVLTEYEQQRLTKGALLDKVADARLTQAAA